MHTGLLISFEGIDGCGKSTQLTRFAARLSAAGTEPLLVREPGGTGLGERIRALVLDPATGDIDAAAEALLYAASRAELVASVIEPALAAGRIVIADRYVDSSLAYQGAGRDLGIDRVLEANLLATRGRLPDVTVFVDVDPVIATARVGGGGDGPDRLEAAGDEFFTAVHRAYAELAERWPARVIRVDGDGTPDEVERRVDGALAPFLARHGTVLPSLGTPA